jgi:hypothetical protein
MTRSIVLLTQSPFELRQNLVVYVLKAYFQNNFLVLKMGRGGYLDDSLCSLRIFFQFFKLIRLIKSVSLFPLILGLNR